jgi:DeoR family transcriptional regulator, fructose operon transcriptional repressor
MSSAETPMFATERQYEIAELARARGRVDVGALGRAFGVTTETIRRDLTRLEEVGVLRRVHGGAVLVERLPVVASTAQRMATMPEAKREIARAALEEIPDTGSVLIDAGTTTVRLAELFPTRRELTVVTNAAPIALALAGKPQLTVHVIGGRLRGETLAAVGPWALATIGEINVDVAFIGTQGISSRSGVTTPDPSEAAVKRAMVAAARRVIVLADHTKLETDHFSRVASLEEVDLLITDRAATSATRVALEAAGLAVRVAGDAV